jgi:hypothetical protein
MMPFVRSDGPEEGDATNQLGEKHSIPRLAFDIQLERLTFRRNRDGHPGRA